MTDAGESPRTGRLASGKARLATERTKLVERFEEVRSRSGLLDALARAWEHDSQVGGGLLGGALAFRLFLFMVPYVLVVFTLLGAASRVATSSPTEMAHTAGISGVLAQGIFTTSSLTDTHRFVLIALGGWATLSAARAVVTTLIEAHRLAWHVGPVKVKKWLPALVFIVFVTVTAAASSYIGRLRAEAPAPGLALTLAWIAIPVVAWWWASSRLPHADAPVWALLPGAVLFAVGLQAMHMFTVLWMGRQVSHKSETYGALGVALTVLAWCYLVGRVVSGAAVLNAALWRRFEELHPDRVEAAAAGERGDLSRVRLLLAWITSAAGLLR
ncbi:MAG: YhjD/YihY/BrkB family envelope integrity protein [Acidimicrobiales bacterium]